MSVQQGNFKAIADAIRAKTGETNLIKPSSFADKIADVFTEGKKAEHNNFWDVFQSNGKAVISYMFYGACWTDDIYTPKYPIVFNTSANAVFGMSKITDTKVDISIPMSGVIQTFYGAGSLITIPSLTVTENTTFSSWFSACKALQNITIHGTIGNTISFSVCPLSKKSVENIVSALSDTATGQTITLNDAQMESIYGNTGGWDKLIATKPNWTFSLA